MSKTYKRGDHVEWNSEAGRVRSVIVRKVVSDIHFKGYVHHASKDEPQYIIKSDETDHIAIHKGRALKRVKDRTRTTRRRGKKNS
jgi:hypothetical protein